MQHFIDLNFENWQFPLYGDIEYERQSEQGQRTSVAQIDEQKMWISDSVLQWTSIMHRIDRWSLLLNRRCSPLPVNQSIVQWTSAAFRLQCGHDVDAERCNSWQFTITLHFIASKGRKRGGSYKMRSDTGNSFHGWSFDCCCHPNNHHAALHQQFDIFIPFIFRFSGNNFYKSLTLDEKLIFNITIPCENRYWWPLEISKFLNFVIFPVICLLDQELI